MRLLPMSRSMPRRMWAVPRVVSASSVNRRIDTSAFPGSVVMLTRQISCRIRGSTASRKASPNSVKPSVATASAALDTTTGTQLSDRNW